MLGTRGDPIYDKIEFPHLREQYERMINNIISETDVVIDFDKESELLLKNKKRDIEPKMADDGEYSNDLIGGFVGKADKHIRKIAAVLHCCENWSDGGQRSRMVNKETTLRACAMFVELADRFIQAVDDNGFSGTNSEIEKLIEYFTTRAEKGKLKIIIPALVSNVSKSKPFNGTQNITSRIRNEVLPELAKRNYCIVLKNTVYINPRLK